MLSTSAAYLGGDAFGSWRTHVCCRTRRHAACHFLSPLQLYYRLDEVLSRPAVQGVLEATRLLITQPPHVARWLAATPEVSRAAPRSRQTLPVMLVT
jgi:hypothetical protein